MSKQKLFRQETKFIIGASKPQQLPELPYAEIAFVGKSNVGKSSLLNAVCNRKTLARVSHTPGRTQQINLFLVAEKFVLADLPGYGYAKVSQTQRQSWEKLILAYLTRRENLRLANLLIDARRGIKENDLMALELLKDIQGDLQLVFTKADEIKDRESLTEATLTILQKYNLATIPIIFTSARSKEGVKEMQSSFTKYF